MKKSLFAAIAVVITFTSCEKEVNFNLPNSVSEKMVVEGSIEKNRPPIVMITKSFGFFSKVDFSKMQEAFLHGAIVKVSDGTREIQLREYSIDTMGSYFSIYTVDTARPTDLTFLGAEGKSYRLNIQLNGKTYEATTSIPAGKGLDSIWSEPLPEMPDSPQYKKLMARYTDPDTLGNRVRVYTSLNGSPFLTSYFSVRDDAVINGTSVKIEIPKGVIAMDTSKRNRDFFKVGDTVTVKWSAIDKATYDFWQTLEFSIGTNGNPFSTPIKVGSNISNGALGVWAGYNPKLYTLVIKQ